jgi:hypothetical protein
MTLALTACGPPPEREEIESRQQAAETAKEMTVKEMFALASKYFGYVQQVENWVQGRNAAAQLRRELDAIHERLNTLARQIADTQHFVERAVLDAKITDLEILRGQLKAGLDLTAMGRFDTAVELQAAGIANALTSWQFYEFPARNGGRKFDPRLATTTFLQAVTIWITTRAAMGLAHDDITRSNLRRYAGHLEQIIARTRASVTCNESCNVFETVVGRCPPLGGGECATRWVFEHRWSCQDEISGDDHGGRWNDGAGVCEYNWSNPYPQEVPAHIERFHAPGMLIETAALWRRIANQ